jgi:hypothetical protein
VQTPEGTFRQRVSMAPSEREDVAALQVRLGPCPRALDLTSAYTQAQLDKLLQLRQARENGLCPVREDLFMQTFGATAAASAALCTTDKRVRTRQMSSFGK